MQIRSALATLSIFLSVGAFAQTEFTGYHMYPSLRNFTGLPGSGFGVAPSDRLSFGGAMAYGTPIAYTPGDWQYVFGATIVADGNTLAFSDQQGGGSAHGNGTMQFIVGATIKGYGNLSYGFVLLSSKLDSVGSLQFTPIQHGPVTFAVGVLDVAGNGGASGQGLPGDNDNSRSPYIVGTWQANPESYVTVGFGSVRYQGFFASACTNLSPKFKAVLEQDSRVWTGMVAYDLGPVIRFNHGDRPIRATLGLGSQAFKFGFWSLNFTF